MEVGAEIRRLRVAKEWSQAKLAGAADMGVSGISQIETGARNPSAVTLSKIADALGVGVADLFPKAQPPLPEIDEEVEDRGFDSPARSYRLPAPHDLEQRREIMRGLSGTGTPEATHDVEDYWRTLTEITVPKKAPDDGIAEKLFRFGGQLVAWWESELPKRLEAEDEEWVRHTWRMYLEFIDILNGIRLGPEFDESELLTRLLDVNAAAHRIQGQVRRHNERRRDAGRKELVLQEMT